MARVLIATPSMGTVRAEYVDSLLKLDMRGHECFYSSISNSLVYEARNQLVLDAIKRECKYILFLDSDMTFPPDTLTRLVADAEEGHAALVSGLTFTRVFPIKPTILKHLDYKDATIHEAKPYTDYPKDRLFEIWGAGMAVCLVDVDAITRVAARYKCSPFAPLPGMSEDYSLCWRLREMGLYMYCDSRVKTGHVGTLVFDEELYLKQRKSE